MTEAAPSRPGLRERKKARTYATIQRCAVDLFLAKGYAATTIEEIAEAAEVSPSTVFRYFPTKIDLVVTDEWDGAFVEALRRQPHGLGLGDAFRAAARETFGAVDEEDRELMRLRARLMAEAPEMRSASLEQILASADMLTDILVERSSSRHDDLEALRADARTFALALLGVVAGAAISTFDAAAPYAVPDVWWSEIPAAIDRLQAGFHL